MANNNENKSYYSSLKGFRRAVPIILITLAVFLAACMLSHGTGAVGEPVRAFLLGAFSFGSYAIPLLIAIHALCYASDVANGRVGARIGFTLSALICSSCIEYAITFSSGDAVFAPLALYSEGIGGGFIGGIIGFAFTHLIGYIGAIIICVTVLAIYATFFFADKTGAYGRAAKAFAARLASLLSRVDDKINDANERKLQLKEEQEQLQREQTSEDLADDDFFAPSGPQDSVTVSQRVPKKETPSETEPRMPRRSERPLDLSYGLESTESEPVEEEVKESVSAYHALGLDDNPENVFTRDFDPFDFATSEKLATKRSSKTPAVEEEIDEFTLYEMKANHMPTEREKRMMELEKRKKEWLAQKNARKAAEEASKEGSPVSDQATAAPVSDAQATNTTSPDAQATVATASTPQKPASWQIVSEQKQEERHDATLHKTKEMSPAEKEPVKAAPVTASVPTATFETAIPTEVNAYTSYNTTKTTYNTPINGFSFDNQPSSEGEATEDVAILISKKIAASNPAYARSANEMRTFTKVTASPDDNILSQFNSIPTPDRSVESADRIFGAAVPTPKQPEDVKEEKQVFSFDFSPEPVPEREMEFGIGADSPFSESQSEVVENESKASYERAAEFAAIMAGFNGESAPKEEFKPYIAPTPAEPKTEPYHENKIKVERSMLSPSPEVISFKVDEPSGNPIGYDAPAYRPTPAPVAEPTAQPTAQPIAQPVSELTVSEPVKNENIAEEILFTKANAENDTSDEIGFDAEDVSVPFEDSDDNTHDEFVSVEEYDEDEDVEEEPEEQINDEEIPPEEQNPDVIKMREMFPFLTPIDERTAEKEEEPEVEDDEDDLPFDDPTAVKEEPKKSAAPTMSLVPQSEAKQESKKNKPDYSSYQFPPIDLLTKEESSYDGSIQAEIQENADKLIETLGSFGVVASIKGVDRGPRITRYEVVPAKGVKVSSILNLQDDIALNLAAGSIRMEAPIPGKSAVGIEIPNKKSTIVRLRNLLETEDFVSSKSKTFVCIGRDVAGQPVFGDISKMPHLLIAGATGMGKSVCINSLLISVLYKARPDEVKLIMIDPKQVEFTMYNGIPHLLVPVVSDPKQAAGSLMWAVEEMERRYNLLNPLCVRNIDAYNEKVAQDPSLGEPMPRIIIVIDEFADLMLQVKDPVETLVMRIAQKARAAGIYLVIGTQRPSVNVITGVIKANVPSRISCKVMSNVDSKTVLDSAGAEKLLDRGDALYAPAGSPKPHRVQCAFVSDGEVEAIMNYLKKYSDGTNYDSSVMEEIERAAQKCSKKGDSRDRDDDDIDESGEGYLNDRQFLDAVEVAVNTRKISTSLIQRKLSVGYGKAAKFIDIMEDMGIVGESNGSRPREVLLTPDEWREKLARASLD